MSTSWFTPFTPRPLATDRDPNRLEQEAADMGWLMAAVEGRRFIWSHLARCGVFCTSYTGDTRTYFNEGRRDVGLELLASLHASCPHLTALMWRENAYHDRNHADDPNT